MEKEQTTFDVQIGDGMDIGIMGENGESSLMLNGKEKPKNIHIFFLENTTLKKN